jgi:hypothetical protein
MSGYAITLRLSRDRLRGTIRVEDRVLGGESTIDLRIEDGQVIEASAEIPTAGALLLERAGIEIAIY